MDFSLVVDGQVRVLGGNLVPIGALVDVDGRDFRQALCGAAFAECRARGVLPLGAAYRREMLRVYTRRAIEALARG